jgi:hypothetical protein
MRTVRGTSELARRGPGRARTVREARDLWKMQLLGCQTARAQPLIPVLNPDNMYEDTWAKGNSQQNAANNTGHGGKDPGGN